MKFKQQVLNRLEAVEQRIEIVIRETENQRMTVTDLNGHLKSVGRGLESIKELIELELEELR